MPADPLTKIQSDYQPATLATFQEIIRASYAEVDNIARQSAIFEQPNREMLAGTLRWGAVERGLYRAGEIGLLGDLKAEWVPLNGKSGPFALQLQGEMSSMLAHHLCESDDSVRESKLRDNKRLVNARSPYLFQEWNEEDARSADRANLTLVHGNKVPDFAYLRAYNDPTSRSGFIDIFTMNIMKMPAVQRGADFEEQIEEVKVAIRSQVFGTVEKSG